MAMTADVRAQSSDPDIGTLREREMSRDFYGRDEPAAPQPGPRETGPVDEFANVPDEWLDEAADFYEECLGNFKMSLFLDCRCAASGYLGERIRQGRLGTKSSILAAIAGTCPNGTELAGYTYEECKKLPALLPLDQTVEDYCSCYASTYAKNYERSGAAVNSLNIVGLQSSARIACLKFPQRR